MYTRIIHEDRIAMKSLSKTATTKNNCKARFSPYLLALITSNFLIAAYQLKDKIQDIS